MTTRQRLRAYASGGYGLSMNALVYFLVPLRAAEMGASLQVIGLLLGTKALTETVLSVPLGALMDRAGTRRAFVLGTGGTFLVGLGLMAAPSLVSLFLLLAALGAVRPLGWVGAQSYVSGMRSEAERSYDTGRFSFSANLGQIVAPLVAGAAVELVGVRSAFAVVVLYGAVFLLLGLSLPETGRAQAPAPENGRSFGAALRLLRLRGMQVVMLLTFTRLWVPSVWSSFLPLYLVSVGTAASIAGSALSFMAVVATVTSLFAGRIARLGRPGLVTAGGLSFGCVGLALSPMFTAVPAVYLPAAMVGFSQGVSLPLLLVLVSAATPAGQRSLALGLRSSVNQAAATAAPVLIAPILAVAGLAVGFPVAAAVGGSFLVVALMRDRAWRVEQEAARDS